MHSGVTVDFSQAGVLGHFMQSCQTIREANALGATFFSLNNPYLEITMEETPEYTYCRYTPKTPFCEEYPTIAAELTKGMMTNAYTNNEKLAGAAIPLEEVSFTFEEPKDTYFYNKIFRVKPKFNQLENCIVFSTHWLNQTTVSYNQELYTVLYNYIQQHYKLPQELLSQKVKQFILGEIDLMHQIEIEDVAKKFMMSVRSLQRKLKEEETSFNQLYEQCRKDLAVLLLKKPELPISDIAYHLNYSSNAAFTKAFKRWESISPEQYRKALVK
ncbi:MAG: AraC family transcriptional regulator [Aureispira sp.]|nr:AraC family transcriptional regulator [Aureispira sp.]